MPSLDELASALKQADAAGDTEGATRLAAAYKQQASAPAPDASVPQAVAPAPVDPNAQAVAQQTDAAMTGDVGDRAFAGMGKSFLDGVNGLAQAAVAIPAVIHQKVGDRFDDTPVIGSLLKNADYALQGGQVDQTERDQASQGLMNTGGGKFGNVAGQVLQSSIPVGGAVAKGGILAKAAAGALTGAALSQLQPVGEGDYLSQKGQQAAVGGAVGAALPLAGSVIHGVAQQVVPVIEPAVRNLANRAAQLGIDISPAQLTSSQFLKTLKSVVNKFPLSGADTAMRGQQDQFNSAVANTFGSNATQLTPTVMQAAKDRIGNEFNQVAANTQIQIDPSFANKIGTIFSDMGQVLTPDLQVPLAKTIDRIVDLSQNGTIPGKAYQALTAKGSPLSALQQAADPTVRQYASQIRNALDDALQASSSPADVQRLITARSQYRNMKTIEDLTEKSPTGDISPALLMNQVRNNTNNMAYGGGGDLADLARVGQKFLKDNVADSATAQRSGIQNAFVGLGKLAAGGASVGGASYALGVPAAAALGGGAVSVGAARAVRSLLDNPKVAQMMLNRTGQARAALQQALEQQAGQAGYLSGGAARKDPPPLEIEVSK